MVLSLWRRYGTCSVLDNHWANALAPSNLRCITIRSASSPSYYYKWSFDFSTMMLIVPSASSSGWGKLSTCFSVIISVSQAASKG